MDRYYSSAISKESSDIYSIPNSTQRDARQRCPALIVLKEENNNNGWLSSLSHNVDSLSVIYRHLHLPLTVVCFRFMHRRRKIV